PGRADPGPGDAPRGGDPARLQPRPVAARGHRGGPRAGPRHGHRRTALQDLWYAAAGDPLRRPVHRPRGLALRNPPRSGRAQPARPAPTGPDPAVSAPAATGW